MENRRASRQLSDRPRGPDALDARVEGSRLRLGRLHPSTLRAAGRNNRQGRELPRGARCTLSRFGVMGSRNYVPKPIKPCVLLVTREQYDELPRSFDRESEWLDVQCVDIQGGWEKIEGNALIASPRAFAPEVPPPSECDRVGSFRERLRHWSLWRGPQRRTERRRIAFHFSRSVLRGIRALMDSLRA